MKIALSWLIQHALTHHSGDSCSNMAQLELAMAATLTAEVLAHVGIIPAAGHSIEGRLLPTESWKRKRNTGPPDASLDIPKPMTSIG